MATQDPDSLGLCLGAQTMPCSPKHVNDVKPTFWCLQILLYGNIATPICSHTVYDAESKRRDWSLNTHLKPLTLAVTKSADVISDPGITR